MGLPAPGLQALTSANSSLSVPQSTVALRPIHTFAQTSLLSRACPPPERPSQAPVRRPSSCLTKLVVDLGLGPAAGP